MSTREMSLSQSASWRCRSTPPTQCGCQSGKPSGSFSSWPSEEQRAEGGRREGEGGGGGGRDGKLTGRCRHFFSDTRREQWAQERKTCFAKTSLPFYEKQQKENISSTQQCRGCSFPSFARLKKEIGICVTSSQKVLLVDRRLPGTISKVGE